MSPCHIRTHGREERQILLAEALTQEGAFQRRRKVLKLQSPLQGTRGPLMSRRNLRRRQRNCQRQKKFIIYLSSFSSPECSIKREKEARRNQIYHIMPPAARAAMTMRIWMSLGGRGDLSESQGGKKVHSMLFESVYAESRKCWWKEFLVPGKQSTAVPLRSLPDV